MRSIGRRMSYANVAATLALVFSMTGGAYALVVNGGVVQDESLTGADVRNDSLSGRDVSEPSLGKVPAAASADSAAIAGSATTAADAERLEGKRSSDFLAASGKAADSDKLDGLDANAFADADMMRVVAGTLNKITLTMDRASGNTAAFTATGLLLKPGTTMVLQIRHLVGLNWQEFATTTVAADGSAQIVKVGLCGAFLYRATGTGFFGPVTSAESDFC